MTAKPKVCPTCGSDDPKVAKFDPISRLRCPNSFHELCSDCGWPQRSTGCESCGGEIPQEPARDAAAMRALYETRDAMIRDAPSADKPAPEGELERALGPSRRIDVEHAMYDQIHNNGVPEPQADTMGACVDAALTIIAVERADERRRTLTHVLDNCGEFKVSATFVRWLNERIREAE